MHNRYQPDRLLTPAEVADINRVDPKTVTRWAAAGKMPAIRTPGGHRRFYWAAVLAVMEGRDPWAACEHHGLPVPPRPAPDTEPRNTPTRPVTTEATGPTTVTTRSTPGELLSFLNNPTR